ncbi:polysaccharide deacetylase family protein [Kibdelosporangium phytohabitans]|uniref:Glycosyl transferase n=1 Tax=Kibdelosporangium phytohabitans TaxID=860235 RepID=A0A0N9IGM5_9PSEU|nr:polysaccharide deacetylase family protein [Kibdelosporangium phytohabitans]ALG14070.1 glycosyl transferase [Kibdelosporangium phytohabitans]MBE1466959.1 peptidoglycan/xylan/chitin deacetylase (PgdA/CDA1 family) [Kibdelosporangium phytohabitans]
MPAKVINLTVHGIGKPPRELDPGEDGTWVTVEQFDQVMDAVVDRPDVRITFDDGNSSDVEIALPRLLERGLTAEFFVLAGLLGESGRLDRAGVRELMAAGMRIGSHGWSHRDWRRADFDQAVEEMVTAPQLLASITGHPVTRVAVPFGSYDRVVLTRLRHAGASLVYTSDGGAAAPDSWLQARTSLRHDIDPSWTADVLAGQPGLRRSARRLAAGMVKRTRGPAR